MKIRLKIKKFLIEICRMIKCKSSCFNDNHIEYNYSIDPPIQKLAVPPVTGS